MEYMGEKNILGKLPAFVFTKIKEMLASIIYNKLFSFWQFLGFHIIKNHFYQPIPDTRTLSPDLWGHYSELVGINMNEKEQLRLLAGFSSNYKNEYEKFPLKRSQISHPYEYYVNNQQFESVDGVLLYCMIRHFKPERIIEIGSGNSTYLSAQAIQKNKAAGHNCD